MDVAELVNGYPQLFHMAENGSWDSVRTHGLLSTSALLDLFACGGDARRSIEEMHRPDSVEITHPEKGRAVIRDQKPMSDAGLVKSLRDGLTPQQWYRTLNSKVFFWVSRNRLNVLLNAGSYRQLQHDVIVLDTAAVMRDYAQQVVLSPMNSGCTKPFPHPRGLATFLPIAEYPYQERLKKKPQWDAVVEVAIEGGIANVRDYALRVESRQGDNLLGILWER